MQMMDPQYAALLQQGGQQGPMSPAPPQQPQPAGLLGYMPDQGGEKPSVGQKLNTMMNSPENAAAMGLLQQGTTPSPAPPAPQLGANPQPQMPLPRTESMAGSPTMTPGDMQMLRQLKAQGVNLGALDQLVS